MGKEYTVKQGDCINSIAFSHGLFWKTIWDHPNNTRLKQLRTDPSVLKEGDVIYIPDITIKWESGTTEHRQRFRIKGVPAKLKIRILIHDQPCAHQPFTLYADDIEFHQGATDGDGYAIAPIPPKAKRARLHVGTGEETDIFVFQLGTVDPIDTEEGIRGRLHNMGYDVSNLAEAIRAFQTKENLNVTGMADSSTQARLQEKFGQ